MAGYNTTPEQDEKIKKIEDKHGLNEVKTPEELAHQDAENDNMIENYFKKGRDETSVNIKPNQMFEDRKRKAREEREKERKGFGGKEELQSKMQLNPANPRRGPGGKKGAEAPPARPIEEIGSFADCLSDEERVLYIQTRLKEDIERKHHDEDEGLGKYNGYFYSSWGELVLNDDLQGDSDK